MFLSIGHPDIENLDPASIDPGRHALFLDFDGTIAHIAESPEAAYPTKRWSRLLPRLGPLFGGAVAFVTGRDLADIDKRVGKLGPFAIGAMYGVVRRSLAGMAETGPDLHSCFDEIAQRLLPLVQQYDGLLVEEKPAGVSLHYRARPDLVGLCHEAMQAAVEGCEGVEVIEGKRVFEVRPRGVDKGRCIREFMAQPPFAGRRPMFAGDDVPDEDGFAAVNALAGISIKVGKGVTAAAYSTSSPTSLAAWFEKLVPTTRIRSGI